MPAWFDDLVDAITAGEQRYLSCGTCEAAFLPPRRFCPECGSTERTSRPLSDRGRIVSFTEISVTTPKFRGETPYTVVLVEFDEGVTLTGQLRDATVEDVDIGDAVRLGTEPHEGGTPLLTFRPTGE